MLQLKIFDQNNFTSLPQISLLSDEEILAIKTVSQVLPFRVNQYVVNSLIDWNNIPEDPIFQMTFPQKGMITSDEFLSINQAINRNYNPIILNSIVNQIRSNMNPHPGHQKQMNIPVYQDKILEGVQHKYPETVLFFPNRGQTCHTYCTFCFRWAQFIGDKSLRFGSNDLKTLKSYLTNHKGVTDILITGGDPLIMKTVHLSSYLELFLIPELNHIQNIRIGTKSLSYWPYRFVTDNDADALLKLFEKLIKAGKHISIMAHINHPREMETDICISAIKRIQSTGAIIRSQAPILRKVNDSFKIWIDSLKLQIKNNIIPYYMFVERDTGPYQYFKISLENALNIYTQAIQQSSGLARTLRGPVMSTTFGKILIHDMTELNYEKLFVLSFLQARNPNWVGKIFYAKYDRSASWFDDLQPGFGEKYFFNGD